MLTGDDQTAKPLARRLHSCASFVSVLALLAACGGGSHTSRPVIGVVQVSSLTPLDEAREGFYKALADSGFVRDVNVTFLERNAQGDIPTLSLIMRDFVQQGVTQVATLSSIATQTAMKVITDRPIVFGAVANPYAINAGTSPTNHRPNVTGAEIPLPVDSALGIARTTFPKAGA
ncbi:MAG TPA: ABC transporter substrate binding protein, partial [Ilumatobacteraceae bacterium]|nr:ABC transporter substrate binding protein [Ilumatobacteraceae bacterium]